MVQGKINRGRNSDYPAERHSIRTNQCPPPPSRQLEKQRQRLTEEKMLAAKAAAVVRDVKNVALPAAVSVCHMRSGSEEMEPD